MWGTSRDNLSRGHVRGVTRARTDDERAAAAEKDMTACARQRLPGYASSPYIPGINQESTAAPHLPTELFHVLRSAVCEHDTSSAPSHELCSPSDLLPEVPRLAPPPPLLCDMVMVRVVDGDD